MKSLYDYDNNINIITTPNGDTVITMNEAIFTEMLNAIYDGQVAQKADGLTATAENTNKLWTALYDKENESRVEKQ